MIFRPTFWSCHLLFVWWQKVLGQHFVATIYSLYAGRRYWLKYWRNISNIICVYFKDQTQACESFKLWKILILLITLPVKNLPHLQGTSPYWYWLLAKAALLFSRIVDCIELHCRNLPILHLRINLVELTKLPWFLWFTY